MTWWGDFLAQSWDLFFGLFNVGPVADIGNSLATTTDAFTQFFLQFVAWIPALIAIAPIVFTLWFLDAAISTLMSGDIKPLGFFLTTLASLIIGVGQAITNAIPL